MNFRKPTFRLAPAALWLLAGCSGEYEDSVSLVSVKGTITRNSEPLANAQIAFVPDPANADQTAGGDVTGPAGTFLAKFRSRSGLAPGKYKVVISPGPEGAEGAADAAAEAAFANDPLMLAEMRRSAASGSRKAKKVEYKEELDVEVPAAGLVFDHDLKPPGAAAAKPTTTVK